ncbi:MAG: succinylglutamate desuccinylase/aspartoacylase family protein [Nitrososphaeria archaeon]
MKICNKTIGRGEKAYISLFIGKMCNDTTLAIPLTVINGYEEGPVLCVVGGVHGDEYEGPCAISEIIRELDPKKLKGTFIGVPVLNILAYRWGSRVTPDDKKNLARVFPGKKDGTITEKIAYTFTKEIITKSDYIIDLHSGGTDYSYANMLCYFDVPGDVGKESLELAEMFPISIIFRSLEKPVGRLIDTAINEGVPSMGTECKGEGRYREEDKNLYILGIKNVMKKLNMIDGDIIGLPKKRTFVDLIEIKSEHEGFLKTHLEPGQYIKKGEILGTLVNIFDTEICKFKAENDGIVLAIKTKPIVKPGDCVFILGKEYTSGKYWPKVK